MQHDPIYPNQIYAENRDTSFASLTGLILALLLALGPAAASNPLPVDQAFRLNVTKDAGGSLILNWQIADGYYLYRDHIAAMDGQGRALAVETQPGQPKDDPNFGRLEVYYTHASASLKADGEPVQLTYQGCQEDGICYRPETRTVDPVTLAVSSEMGRMSRSLAKGSPFVPAVAPAADMASPQADAQTPAFALAPERAWSSACSTGAGRSGDCGISGLRRPSCFHALRFSDLSDRGRNTGA